MLRHLKGLLALAAGMFVAVSPAIAEDVRDLRVGVLETTDHAAVFIALEKGYFAQHGLDAKIVIYPTGVEMINGQLSGQHDVSTMGSIPFLAGVSRGQPLRLIGLLHGDPTRNSYAAQHSLVSTIDGADATSLDALKGTRVGLPRGTGSEGYFLGVLEAAGLSADDVRLLNIKPADLTIALKQGHVETIAGWEPWASTAVRRVDNAQRIISDNCEDCFDPGTLLTTAPILEEKREELKRFLTAFAQAQQSLRGDYEGATEIVGHWVSGVDDDILLEAVQRTSPDMRLSRNVLVGYNDRVIPLLAQEGRIPQEFDAASAIDASLQREVQEAFPEYFSDLPAISKADQF